MKNKVINILRTVLTALIFLCLPTPVSSQAKGSLAILQDKPLSGIEGLWSMTGEDLLVLILRNHEGRLEMTVAPENAGSGYKSGSIVGYLEPTAESDSYWLYLEDVPRSVNKRHKNVLGTHPFSKRCVLRHREDGELLTIEKGGVDMTFNPLSYFPYLNRLIRLRFSDPNAKIREGFRKIAPGFDGAVGSNRRPVYF